MGGCFCDLFWITHPTKLGALSKRDNFIVPVHLLLQSLCVIYNDLLSKKILVDNVHKYFRKVFDIRSTLVVYFSC